MYSFNKPYERNSNAYFTPVFKPGENYSFYFNSDEPIQEVRDEYYLSFQKATELTTAYLFPVGTVKKVSLVTADLAYNLYADNFLCPSLPDGEYYLVLLGLDGFIYSEKARSQIVRISSNCLSTTSLIKYRHNDILYGIRYDLLPDFYNQFRLTINQINAPEFKSEREQYRESSNGREIRNAKSFRDTILTLEVYFCDDDDLEAISAILEHTDVYFNGYKVMNYSPLKVDKNSPFNKLSKATFEIIVDTYGADYSAYESYGDFVADGGGVYAEDGDFITFE